jgi:hypothetical protein
MMILFYDAQQNHISFGKSCEIYASMVGGIYVLLAKVMLSPLSTDVQVCLSLFAQLTFFPTNVIL